MPPSWGTMQCWQTYGYDIMAAILWHRFRKCWEHWFAGITPFLTLIMYMCLYLWLCYAYCFVTTTLSLLSSIFAWYLNYYFQYEVYACLCNSLFCFLIVLQLTLIPGFHSWYLSGISIQFISFSQPLEITIFLAPIEYYRHLLSFQFILGFPIDYSHFG